MNEKIAQSWLCCVLPWGFNMLVGGSYTNAIRVYIMGHNIDGNYEYGEEAGNNNRDPHHKPRGGAL